MDPRELKVISHKNVQLWGTSGELYCSKPLSYTWSFINFN